LFTFDLNCPQSVLMAFAPVDFTRYQLGRSPRHLLALLEDTLAPNIALQAQPAAFGS